MTQLAQLSTRLYEASPPVRLTPILIARSKQMLYSEAYRPLSLSSWQDDLAASRQPLLDTQKLVDYIASAPGKVVLVDNTSSFELGKLYPELLTRGVNIVTPNKKAFSGSFDQWSSIFSSAANGTGPATSGHIYHESTVGAGLPVISTLKDLIDTGDQVTHIQGVFSGTMSFLFNSFNPLTGNGGTFSAEVANAKQKGYTEPDPRDDLNGLDVARKLTILARLAGLSVPSPTSFPIQSLVPQELEDPGLSADAFTARLPEFDDRMEKLKADAAAENKVVRFVGSIDVAANKIKVGLETFEHSHPIAALQGSDNIISFRTERYGANPLIVQGAGAGGDVTAMGTTADLLRVVRAVLA